MRAFGLFFILIWVVIITLAKGHQVSDKRKCADPKCEELISVGKTVNQYRAIDEGLVSFPKDADVKVFSKEAGSNPQLWGVEIRGKRGYANKAFIKETKVFASDKSLTHEVPTSTSDQSLTPEKPKGTIITMPTDDEPDDEPGEEADDQYDEADPSNDVESDGNEFNGGENFEESGEEDDPKTLIRSPGSASQLIGDNDQLSVANQSVPAGSAISDIPSANYNDRASSTPVVSSPTTPGYNVLDGTTIYEEDASALPHYRSETQTPPPLQLSQVTQTVPLTEASQYVTDLPEGELTPKLEVVPSGEPIESIIPSEVVSDPVLSTGDDSSMFTSTDQVSAESQTTSLPVLLSTLSSTVSDDSQVHATTFPAEEHTFDSNHAPAEEGSVTTDDAKQIDTSKVEDVRVEPSAVDPEPPGFLSTIASFASIFSSGESPETEQPAAGDGEKANDNDLKKEADEKAGEHKSEPPLLNVVADKDTSVSGDINQEMGKVENIPVNNPTDPLIREENELNTQVPDNSKDEAPVAENSDSPVDNSTELGSDHGSDPAVDRNSAGDDRPDLASDEGSDPAVDSSSEPVDIEGSGSSDEGPGVQDSEGEPSSIPGSNSYSNDDSLPDLEGLDIDSSHGPKASDPFNFANTSPGQEQLHKFITSRNVDHTDVDPVESATTTQPPSTENDMESLLPHPETTTTSTTNQGSDEIAEGLASEAENDAAGLPAGEDETEGVEDLSPSEEHGEIPVAVSEEAHLDPQHSQRRVSRSSRVNASKVKPIVRTKAPELVVPPFSLLSTKSDDHTPTHASSITSTISPYPVGQRSRNTGMKTNKQGHCFQDSFEDLVTQFVLNNVTCRQMFASSFSMSSDNVVVARTQMKGGFDSGDMELFSSIGAVDSDISTTVDVTQDLETFLNTPSYFSYSKENQLMSKHKTAEGSKALMSKGVTADQERSTVEPKQINDLSNSNDFYNTKENVFSTVPDLTPSDDSINIEHKLEEPKEKNLKQTTLNHLKSRQEENVKTRDIPLDQKTLGYPTNRHKRSQNTPVSVTAHTSPRSDPSTMRTSDNERPTTEVIKHTSLAYQSDPLLLGSLGSAVCDTSPKDGDSGDAAEDDESHNPLKPQRLSGSLVPGASAKSSKEPEDVGLSGPNQADQDLSDLNQDDQSLNGLDQEGQGLSDSSQNQQDKEGLDLHDPNTIGGKLMQVVEPIMVWLSSLSQLGDSLSLALENEASQPHLSSSAFLSVLLLAFGFIIVTLYSVHALFMKCSREGPLLEALNSMEHEQHVAAAVIMQLQEKLVAATSGSPTGGSVTSIVHNSAEVDRLMEELQQVQEEAATQATRIQELEQELEESTSSGLEMHAMLQDLLHEQRDTAGFQDSVDNLQKMLDSQREKVETLTSDLSIKTTLNDELKSEVKSSREKISKLEYQLEQVTHSLEEVSSSKDRAQGQLTEEQSRVQAAAEQVRGLTQSYEQASAALTELQTKHTATEQKTERLQKLLRTKETELHVTKECLKQLKQFNDGKSSKEKLTQMLDVIKVQAQLSSAQHECGALQEQLQQRAEEATGLEEAARAAKEESARCLELQQQADIERKDALSKLDVLTKYFQEKEAQLTKELESESGLRHNAEGSAETVSSRIRDYDMQLLAYKTQVEGLKKELDDQEQSYRAQLATQEQKAHESWVAARAAERKLDESKQETSQLRSRLLLASKDGTDNHAIVKPTPKHPEVSNGSVSSPRPPLHDDLDGEHSLPLNPMDSPPPIPPPHMLPPHLFPPPHGAPPLLPGMPPFAHPPGMHPPGMHPPGMHPGHPFLPPPLPPPMSDRRLPPAGRLASPPFHRRSPPEYLDRHGAPSPPFDQRRSPAHYDRRSYSPSSEHSRYSDRQGRYSPDRHSERQYSDSMHHNDRYHHHHNNGGDRHLDRYSPDRRRDSSPDRWLNRSPDGYARKPSPPRRLYDDQHRKGKKTSTPLGPNDR